MHLVLFIECTVVSITDVLSLFPFKSAGADYAFVELTYQNIVFPDNFSFSMVEVVLKSPNVLEISTVVHSIWAIQLAI